MPDFLRTDDVAEAGRFTQWRHWSPATFVPLECAQVSREPFRGRPVGDSCPPRLVAAAGRVPGPIPRAGARCPRRKAGSPGWR
jgi:hypothetical protein